MRRSLLVPVLVSTLSLAGCELLDELTGAGTETGETKGSSSSSSSSTATSDPTEPATTETSGDTTDTTHSEPVSGDEWRFSWHPCVGHRTDTMWFDDRETVWVGCGSTTEGTGLYLSEDGGRTWGAPDTSPYGFFETFRVSSISRSADGLLYVAGIDTAGSTRVVSVDEDGGLAEGFAAGDQVWNSFHVGTFRRNSEGLAVAESLTSAALVTRFADADAFTDGAGWAPGSYQILDMVLFEDEFYAVGSTISQPPTVFLPPRGGQDPRRGFRMDAVEWFGEGLGAFDGELWGLAVDAGGLLAAGVNQDRDTGVILWSGADPQDLGSYVAADVGAMFPGDPTWMRGACRQGDVLVAVGEFSRRGVGLILRSDDGGASWEDVTPADRDVPPVQRCEVFDDGSLAIAGGDGLFLTYDPS